MKATLLEVLMDLFHHYLEHGNASMPNLNEILDGLDKFTRTLEHQTPDEQLADYEKICLQPAQVMSTRIYSHEECLKLDEKCRGFLMLVEQARIITPELREKVIERALSARDSAIVFGEFKSMILNTVIENYKDHIELKWLNHVMFQEEHNLVRH